jgi:hypothetical protein
MTGQHEISDALKKELAYLEAVWSGDTYQHSFIRYVDSDFFKGFEYAISVVEKIEMPR